MLVCGCSLHDVLPDHNGLRSEDDGKRFEHRYRSMPGGVCDGAGWGGKL